MEIFALEQLKVEKEAEVRSTYSRLSANTQTLFNPPSAHHLRSKLPPLLAPHPASPPSQPLSPPALAPPSAAKPPPPPLPTLSPNPPSSTPNAPPSPLHPPPRLLHLVLSDPRDPPLPLRLVRRLKLRREPLE